MEKQTKPPETTALPALVPNKERFHYGLYFFGQNIFYFLQLSFLLIYFSDIGIPPGTVAILILVVKFWDAINDPIFGGLVDNVRFRSGKFLPWLRISVVAIPVATLFLFAIPAGLPIYGKVIWAAIGYILWDTAYTICDVPIFGLPTTMTDRQHERSTLMAIGRLAGSVGSFIIATVVPSFRITISEMLPSVLRDTFGSWLPVTLLLSLVGFAAMLPICFSARERIRPAAAEEKIKLRSMVRFVFRNKYLLIFSIAMIITHAANISGTLMPLFNRIAMGDEGIYAVMAIVGAGPGLAIGIAVPFILRRIDKFHLYFAALLGSILTTVVSYFVGFDNLVMFYVMSFFRSIFGSFLATLMFMFTPDCAEYGIYRTGVYATGVAFSVQTFSAKMISTLSAALSAGLLALIGFIPGENAVQAPGFASKAWLILNLIPTIGWILSAFILTRYKLRDHQVQIMTRCNAGEITREEAEMALAGRR